MKPITRIFLAAAFFLLLGSSAQAQVTVNVNPPSWGPAVGPNTQYYYVPEYGGYYDLRDRRYLVQRDGKWQRVTALNGYSTASLHPVAIDYVGAQPWTLISRHRTRYPAGLPRGQVKRLENGKGLPPGQAKKYYGRSYEDRRDYDNDDRREGHGKGQGKGQGKSKGHGKD
ncbi:hypothetical protein GCM10022408_33440 [Hymenobacter fastidiosus]|uniref:Uncharacterized protein n=1 Tax=Hymenobacter fastidiosus TaxID=486264 RepID=A0ABP7SVL1_9BACT